MSIFVSRTLLVKGVALREDPRSGDNRFYLSVKCNFINYANNPIFMRSSEAKVLEYYLLPVLERQCLWLSIFRRNLFILKFKTVFIASFTFTKSLLRSNKVGV